jgi:hypothetical protein
MDLQVIQSKIFEIRGCKVMLDVDLAQLYCTETSQLKRAVRRNMERFPYDFMFQLTQNEANNLISIGVCQTGTPQYNFSAYMPFAFTEQGVAMLSSVLRNEIAVKVNISIMRAFVAVRQYILASNVQSKEIEELRQRIKDLEIQGEKTLKVIANLDEEMLGSINDVSEDMRNEIDGIYIALTELAENKPKEKQHRAIGFINHDNEDKK